MMYITSQILVIIAFIISLYAYHKKTKKKILSNTIMANILNILHYLLLGGYSGCITKLLAIVRDYFIICKEKNRKLSNKVYLILFIQLYMIAGVFTFKGVISILPLVAAIIYTIFIWYGNELQIKKVAFYCYFLWIAYNIFVNSKAAVITNIIGAISTFIAIKNYKKRDE